jgi:hypothetical protein
MFEKKGMGYIAVNNTKQMGKADIKLDRRMRAGATGAHAQSKGVPLDVRTSQLVLLSVSTGQHGECDGRGIHYSIWEIGQLIKLGAAEQRPPHTMISSLEVPTQAIARRTREKVPPAAE